MPGRWLFQYSFEKARSVPSFCVTSYWRDVSFLRSSASEGFWKLPFQPLDFDALWPLTGKASARVTRAAAIAAYVIFFLLPFRPRSLPPGLAGRTPAVFREPQRGLFFKSLVVIPRPVRRWRQKRLPPGSS